MTERTLTVFADYVCPYCYLAELELAPLRDAGLVMDVAAYELRPAGTPLLEPDAPWLLEAWERSVLPLARQLGAEMRRPTLQVRTRKAHEAVAFARSQGNGLALHEAIYRAWWQEGRDIGRIDVLSELAESVGLDRTLTRVALDIDQWTERVEEDQALAQQLRLNGVPAYLLVEQQDGARPRAGLRTGLMRRDELEKWVNSDDV